MSTGYEDAANRQYQELTNAGEIEILKRRVTALEVARAESAIQDVRLKSQAAQQQATFKDPRSDPAMCDPALRDPKNRDQNLYAPLRSDTRAVVDLAAFARRLLNPQDLAHAVTLEVRNAARRALGLPEVKEYDL